MIHATKHESGLLLDDAGRLFRQTASGGLEFCNKAEYDALADWAQELAEAGFNVNRLEHVRFYGHAAKEITIA